MGSWFFTEAINKIDQYKDEDLASEAPYTPPQLYFTTAPLWLSEILSDWNKHTGLDDAAFDKYKADVTAAKIDIRVLQHPPEKVKRLYHLLPVAAKIKVSPPTFNSVSP